MKYGRFLSICLAVIVPISGCIRTEGSTNQKARSEVDFVTNHFNITVASDLSNRINPSLYPKPVSDAEIVEILVDNIYPRILTHGRKMNQLDQFRVDFINKKQITAYSVDTENLLIDFSKFKTQQQRMSYLREEYQKDKKKFKMTFRETFVRARSKSYGSDIWTYLQQGLDKTVVNSYQDIGKTGRTVFKNQYRNVLVLITDGYIEAGIFGKGYDLSGKKIAEIRKAFNRSGETDLRKFYQKNPQFKIKPLSNPSLKNLEIIVLELYDRTESNRGATVHPTDYEIMNIAWTDWLKASGVKRLSLNQKFSSRTEAQKIIMDFLGV